MAMMGCYVDEQQRATVFGVYVTPTARGTGVSDALLIAVEEWATAEGHGALRLFVHDRNEPAMRLYTRRGFATLDERQPHPNVPGEFEVIMVKPLAG